MYNLDDTQEKLFWEKQWYLREDRSSVDWGGSRSGGGTLRGQWGFEDRLRYGLNAGSCCNDCGGRLLSWGNCYHCCFLLEKQKARRVKNSDLMWPSVACSSAKSIATILTMLWVYSLYGKLWKLVKKNERKNNTLYTWGGLKHFVI